MCLRQGNRVKEPWKCLNNFNLSSISFNLSVKYKLQWLILITQIIYEDRSHSLCAVDSEIHHAHVIFQIMFYININVWVLMLIFFTNTEASKSERKTTPADPPSLSPSTPTTVSAEAEQDVSVKSQIKEEVEDWPIREMIAILGLVHHYRGIPTKDFKQSFKPFIEIIVFRVKVKTLLKFSRYIFFLYAIFVAINPSVWKVEFLVSGAEWGWWAQSSCWCWSLRDAAAGEGPGRRRRYPSSAQGGPTSGQYSGLSVLGVFLWSSGQVGEERSRGVRGSRLFLKNSSF